MLCEKCKKRPATVFVRRTLNGVTSEAHLCEDCAREQGSLNILFAGAGNLTFPDWSLGNLFSSLLGQGAPGMQAQAVKASTLRCSQCGLTYANFRERGRLGCAQCYEIFRDQLQPLIQRLQGGVKHTGKIPRRAEGKLRLRYDLKSLRRQLQEAVAKEEFELAAKLRDEIKALEQKLGGGEMSG
ncbi:MAG: hypothetical protein GX062_03005 [Firmicutes bacterium]|jgi:protein arginine kinase activator|nr:hypothetical protein [Bacillota bacterium]